MVSKNCFPEIQNPSIFGGIFGISTQYLTTYQKFLGGSKIFLQGGGAATLPQIPIAMHLLLTYVASLVQLPVQSH